MSGLDRSLDQIMKDRPATKEGRRGRGRLPGRKAATKSKAATAAVVAPAGGVQKKTKAAKPIKAPTAPAATGESKIAVSNLPEDVTEALIKDYFASAVKAPVKRVLVNYGPSGRSRGSATVIFGRPTAAQEAIKLHGTPVDGRPMRIELLVDSNSVPAPKPLSQRVSQPKNAAKENEKKETAKPAKPATNGTAPAGKASKKKAKSGRAGRPKAKTAEELDAEMQDYFGGEAAPTNGTAQPAAATNGGDTGMDEVL